MNLQDYAAIVVAIVTVLTGVAALLRFVILHYLAELKPNSGSSIKDQVNRLETRVDKIYELLLSKGE
jgi:CHASE1-domain containing sensor protein